MLGTEQKTSSHAKSDAHAEIRAPIHPAFNDQAVRYQLRYQILPDQDQNHRIDELIEQCDLTKEEEAKIKFTLPTDTMRDVGRKIEQLQDLLNTRSLTDQYDKRRAL